MNSDSLIQSGGEDATILSTIWGARRLFIALASPLFMYTLFSGQANGTITNTVELANKKYGSDPAFQSYVKSVPTIFPKVFSWLKELLFKW